MIRLSLAAALLASVSVAACGSGDREQAETVPAQQTQPVPTGSLTEQSIESAVWQAQPTPPAAPATAAPQPTAAGADPASTTAATPPRADIVRAQILLDRARFSPGSIDGLGGENTRQAVSAFAKANGLASDGELTSEVFAKLTQAATPVLTRYTITAADVAGPFAPVPEGLEAQAELTVLGYASPLEAMAEKFHVTEGLLTGLNPGVDFARPGQTILVPAVSDAPLPAAVTRIVVDKTESSLRAYGADGTLLAFYPATVGSSARPAPSGRLTVVGVANEPNYTYDPERLSYGAADRKLVIAPGPNNPVGSVWIDLSRDTYGIHGTPDPSKISKTASNGCVRLTNWSAEQLAAAVKPGVEVVFS